MGEGGAYEGAYASELDVDTQCLKVISWGGLGSRGDKGQQPTGHGQKRQQAVPLGAGPHGDGWLGGPKHTGCVFNLLHRPL